jgi:hypothetical protein
MNQSTANRTVETLGSVASWLVPLVIYVSTIAPLVTAGDAGEFIVAAHRFSLPPPPGYPLYMLLLKLWTYLPISLGADPYAVRANLFSAVCMAIACGFFYKLMRILSGSAPASLAAALILAVSRTLWKFAVVTEVYGLNMLLTVLVLYGLALASVEKKRSGLVLVSLAFGFGLAHHETIVLLAPMIFSLWPKGRGAAHIHGGTVFFCIVAPLLLYALIPIMAANSPEYSQTGFKFRDFIQTVTRAEYRERASHQNPAEEQLIQSRDIIKRSVDYLGKQFGWFLLALGVLGWLFAPSGRRAWAFWAVITTCIWLVAMAFFSRGSPLGMPFNFLRSIDEFMIPVNMFIAMGFAWLLAPIAVMLTSKADISGTESQNIIAPRYIPLTRSSPLRYSPFPGLREFALLIVRPPHLRAGPGAKSA